MKEKDQEIHNRGRKLYIPIMNQYFTKRKYREWEREFRKIMTDKK